MPVQAEGRAGGEEVPVVAVDIRDFVELCRSEVDGVRTTEKYIRRQRGKVFLNHSPYPVVNRQPMPDAVFKILVQLSVKGRMFLLVKATFPEVPMKYRIQFCPPQIATRDHARLASQLPNQGTAWLREVAFREVGSVEINHLRSSSRKAPESTVISGS